MVRAGTQHFKQNLKDFGNADTADCIYKALREWNRILTDVEGEYWQQLTPGTALSESCARARARWTGPAKPSNGCFLSADNLAGVSL